MGRGQVEVLGIVLLVGMVVAGTVAVTVAGITAMNSVQEATETEQALNELRSVSHEINSLIENQSATAVGVTTPFETVEAGRITVRIDGEKQYRETIGRITKDGIVYEGGHLIDGDRIVRSPTVKTKANSTRISFPTLTGERLTHTVERTDMSGIHVADPTANVSIQIHSEYAEVWYNTFAETTAAVRMVDDNTVHAFFAGGSIPAVPTVDTALMLSGGEGTVSLGELGELTVDSYNSTTGKYRPHTSGDNGSISSPNAIHFAQGGGGNLNLAVSQITSGESIDLGSHKQFEDRIDEDVDVATPTPTREILAEKDPTQGAEVSEATLAQIEEGGRLHTTTDLRISGQSLHIPTKASVFVNGDLTVEQSTIVAGDDLRMYVTGDIEFGDDVAIETDGNPHQASNIGLYTTGNIQGGEPVTGNSAEPDDITITGLVHATDSTVYANGNLEIFGSVSIADIENNGSANNGAFILHHDETLIGTEIDRTTVPDLSVSSDITRDSYYLEIVTPKIETE